VVRGRSVDLEDRGDDVRRELDALRLELAEVSESRRRLATAADAERRDFERDLHHGVQQLLTAIAANLELAAISIDHDPEIAARLLAEIGEDVRSTLEATRQLAHRIYPPFLETGGLVAALRAAAANAGVPVRIDVLPGATCPPKVAGAVYFCCLDLLELAAPGTTVTISVRSEGDAVAFAVVAECDADAEHLPLRDRIEALGGRVTILRSGDRLEVAAWLPPPR
jgi:signal transduction histidine kinase